MSALPVIVIGKTGQLARALANRDGGYFKFYSREDCDLSADKDSIKAFLSGLPKARGLILAAAYTAVDKAETEAQTALDVNGRATGLIANYCASQDIPMVYVSTDYVFSGTADAPYMPDHLTDPINQYGASKLAGEQAIEKSGARAAVLRTSWVFDGTGNNFFTTMLRLGQTRDTLSVVADQIGRPTYAGHLAQACLDALAGLPENAGTYHVSGTGEPISWADFAAAIFDIAKNDLPHSIHVTPIPSTDYPTPAKRPRYSVMNTEKFEDAFSASLPAWPEGLAAAYAEWKAAH